MSVKIKIYDYLIIELNFQNYSKDTILSCVAAESSKMAEWWWHRAAMSSREDGTAILLMELKMAIDDFNSENN